MKNLSSRFSDKIVVITGGSLGIGLATAHEFAKLGCRLALISRREELLQKGITLNPLKLL
ncbi:MAG: SDR family NAD(P)-dependent oxidoreductase [Bacteroidia bacterium]